MTITLQSIGFTLAGGGVVFATAMSLFGCAMRSRSIYIAPRCTARPRDVIYNPHPTHSSQARGSPMVGWIPWVLGLTYPQMLEGVPGTGTRKKGIEGTLLKVNLDGVVLLRFHEMCLRVAVLGTLLCLVVILPLNLSAQCYNFDDEDMNITTICTDESIYNKTDFEKTTLSNIPQLDNSQYARIWGGGYGGLLGRLYVIVFCSWIVTLYVFHTARKEWLDIHAMRRVYYLESDVWGDRQRELQITQQRPEDYDDFEKNGDDDDDDEDSVDHGHRDPWIPHPEQRETVPNIALYSVLVGSLPRLPHQFCEDDDVEKAVVFSKRQSIDWQLEVTKTFFDQCVPNQPGFSSSVAAVTILPGVSKLSRAWSKWYTYAAALRRLRFVRRLASEMRHYDIDSINGNSVTHSERERDKYISKEIAKVPGARQLHEPEPDIPPHEQHAEYLEKQKEQMMEQEQQRYYREVFSTVQDEAEDLFLNPELGPEQAAVYSRELAQSAAQCCPNGCCEGRVMRARIDELNIREQEAIARVQEAYEDLLQAREEAAAAEDEGKNDLFADEPVSPSKLNLPANLTEEAEIIELSKKKEQQDFSVFNMEVGTGAPMVKREISALSIMTGAPRRRESSGESTNRNLRGSPQSGIGFVDVSAAGMRKRAPTRGSHNSSIISEEWEKVEQIVNGGQWSGSVRLEGRHAKAGGWKRPSLYYKDLQAWAEERKEVAIRWWNTTKEETLDDLARETTYAVVTFTSRQAAIAARKCLLDGRGQSRWLADAQVPVPPLADASPCKLCPCRGCCRPVTLTIPDKQKIARNLLCKGVLVTIYVFYTIPLTFAVAWANPDKYDEVFPFIQEFQSKHQEYYTLISGLIPALVWTVFFSICPVMFKTIANIGSNASSVMAAEFKALQYFWWFMVITAFSGNLLSNMVINGFNEGIRIGAEFQKVVVAIAQTVPTSISAAWLNWIIVRFTITLPLNYMLQINTYLFSCLGWNCCKRLVMGGGPGGPIPYRLYVDSGVVFLCLVALAPASPLVAPTCLMYFMYCIPMLRRNVIFMYRPKFDGGGVRWPFLYDVIVSSVLVGQILLTTMMALKRATGPAICAAAPIIPTLLHHWATRRRLKPAFEDLALLQTSTLDGWDPTEATSLEKREDYRKFLVDAHKAAYVPVCIAGCEKGSNRHKTLTAEPAVVVPHGNDPVSGDENETSNNYLEDLFQSEEAIGERRDTQYGASLTRIRALTSPHPSVMTTPRYGFNDDGSVVTSISNSQPHSSSRRRLNSDIRTERLPSVGEMNDLQL